MTYSLSRWKLDALVPPVEGALPKAIKNYQSAVTKVEKWRKHLKPTIATKNFLALLKDYEAMNAQGQKVGYYCSLKFSENTQDQNALAQYMQMEQMFAEAQNRVLFFSLWWRTLDDKNAKRLMKESGDLRYWLEEMRHFKPHTLSEAEEKVINIKNVNGANAIQNLYETFTNKFAYTLDVKGEKKTLTRDSLMVYAKQSDPALRAAAYQELYRVYGEHGPFLAQMFANLMRDWRSENVELRKFKSPIAVRNLSNDIPDPVVETLLKVIRGNAGVFQRYFKLKAKWIGIPSGKLRRYDIYAPLSPSDKEYSYEKGVNMVLDTFKEFSPRVGELAQKVFDDGHVDSEVRPGKRGGAFCASALPGLSPFVLVNYNNRANDVATLAHEMGHAIHALLAADHSVLTFHSALPMAETASVFSEALLTEKLLAQETDRDVKRDIIAKSIDDAYATVGRQGFFALWEKEAHEMVKQGKTADEMAARYLEHLNMQFGDSVEISDEFKWEWVSIPHFYAVPFYVYAYSFGQLMVLSLYEMFKQEGEKFKPKLIKILSYGASEAPAKILSEAGINIKSEKFWQGGFDVIARMIDELERM